jgi:hypothetical protein
MEYEDPQGSERSLRIDRDEQTCHDERRPTSTAADQPVQQSSDERGYGREVHQAGVDRVPGQRVEVTGKVLPGEDRLRDR